MIVNVTGLQIHRYNDALTSNTHIIQLQTSEN